MLKNLNILVADDAPAMRFAIAEVLRNAGAFVAEASSGKEALLLARTSVPDLLLLDVQMPDMSGIEVCEALRAEAFTGPILALCDADENLRNSCLSAGMNAVLPKPCPRKVLLEQIQIYVGRQIQPEPSWEHFSFPSFREFCSGDEAFMQRLLNIASKVLPKTAKDIRAAIASRDMKQVGALAHRVRSSVEGLGLASLACLLREIERLARTCGSESAEMKLLVQKAANELEQAAKDVAQEQARMRASQAMNKSGIFETKSR